MAFNEAFWWMACSADNVLQKKQMETLEFVTDILHSTDWNVCKMNVHMCIVQMHRIFQLKLTKKNCPSNGKLIPKTRKNARSFQFKCIYYLFKLFLHKDKWFNLKKKIDEHEHINIYAINAKLFFFFFRNADGANWSKSIIFMRIQTSRNSLHVITNGFISKNEKELSRVDIYSSFVVVFVRVILCVKINANI